MIANVAALSVFFMVGSLIYWGRMAERIILEIVPLISRISDIRGSV